MARGLQKVHTYITSSRSLVAKWLYSHLVSLSRLSRKKRRKKMPRRVEIRSWKRIKGWNTNVRRVRLMLIIRATWRFIGRYAVSAEESEGVLTGDMLINCRPNIPNFLHLETTLRAWRRWPKIQNEGVQSVKSEKQIDLRIGMSVQAENKALTAELHDLTQRERAKRTSNCLTSACLGSRTMREIPFIDFLCQFDEKCALRLD